MFFLAVTGNAVPAHPCSRGISASLQVIDVRHFDPQDGQAQGPSNTAINNTKEAAT
jgi:hypothetical protein